jgi:two-component system OmpR family response regulator
MRLLLVEDDPEVGGMLTEALRHRGHVVDHVERGADAVWMAAEQRYDVVILDVGLPDLSGLEVCAQLRAQQPVLPVLMLTGHTDVLARVQGLDAGADDYLAKPVSLAELEARLRALARRGERPVVEQYVGREYDLVELLARRAGEVVSRRHLMTQLWDRDAEVTANALDVLVASVRRKLEAPFDQPILTTERGRGYRIA